MGWDSFFSPEELYETIQFWPTFQESFLQELTVFAAYSSQQSTAEEQCSLSFVWDKVTLQSGKAFVGFSEDNSKKR